MNHRLQILAFMLVAAASCLRPAQAAEVYSIDPVHSAVSFSVKHIFTMVPGRFDKFSGSITYDSKQIENSKVEVTIEAASINTNMPKREDHLRSADFLDVEKNQTITFKSTRITKAGENKLAVAGDLTIRGVTKPVTLEAEILGVGPGPDGKTRAGFHATTKINRLDYGVHWNRAMETGGFLLGNDVHIDLSVEAVLQ